MMQMEKQTYMCLSENLGSLWYSFAEIASSVTL